MADEKKIIIDEDWKSQVQAEKEAAAKKTASEPAIGEPAGTVDDVAEEQAQGAPSGSQAAPQLPPASFEMLVTTLATEVLVALGQIPHPVTKKAEIERVHAQYLIDTLDMLRVKTKGNLTEREQQLIDEVLHQVRMVFIAVANEPTA